jgi:hypothetical protein
LHGLGAARPSGEYAPTLPAPNPLEKKTWRLPTPPSALAQARRTPVPPSDDPPAEESSPQSLQDGQEAVLRKALADEREKTRAAEARAAELERQARVQAEAASPATYPPAVTPPAAPAAPVVVQQGVSSETLENYRKAQTKLMLAIAGLLVAVAAPCALWLTNAAMKAESATKRTEVQATEAVKTSESAKVQTTDANQEIAALKAQRQADQLYFIAVMRKLGIHVRKPDGWPDPPTLNVTAPIRKPGQVDDGTSLTVNTPPAP